MHIILAFLTTIVTILILLNRLAQAGIDLRGLNPFLWRRRRKWKNKYEGDPIFKIEDPMDVTAILMIAIAKSDGDMIREDKNKLLQYFETDFGLSKKDAAGLLISGNYLLKDGDQLKANLKKFLASSKPNFTDQQRKSAISLIKQIAGDEMHENKMRLLNKIVDELDIPQKNQNEWSSNF